MAIALAIPSVVALLIYAIATRKTLPSDLRAVEAMASVALVFLLGALGAVPAFVSLGMPLLDALFEAMSGLTTTGLSVASDPDSWPFAAHVLRAWLQWIGGLVMATAVLALILPAGIPTRRLGQVGIAEGDRIASTRTKARQLLVVYLGLTILMIAIAWTVLPSWKEALVLILSGISTGGFAPRSDSLASYSTQGQTIVMASCVLGAISMVSFAFLLRGDWQTAWHLGSVRRVGLSLLALAVIILALAAADTLADRALSWGLYLDLVSALTTAGYSTEAMPLGGSIFLIFLIAMLLGADTGSTGGGLKLARVGLILRTARHALRAPSMPERAVAPLRQDGVAVEDTVIVGVVALLMIYVMATLALAFHFSLHGYDLGPSLFETISALSTVGLSTGLVGTDLPTDLKLTLTFAMWLGRLEFIAVLVLLAPRSWMKGP